MKKVINVFYIIGLLFFYKVEAYEVKSIDLSITNNLSYCVYYFYDDIIDINKTECFDNIAYGSYIDYFQDKPKKGYVLDSFTPITVLNNDDYLIVRYHKVN